MPRSSRLRIAAVLNHIGDTWLEILPRLPRLWAVPWCAGLVLTIVLETTLSEQLGRDMAYTWLGELAWAPFGAMLDVTALRLIAHGRAGTRNGLLWSDTVAVIAVITVAWAVSGHLIDWLWLSSGAEIVHIMPKGLLGIDTLPMLLLYLAAVFVKVLIGLAMGGLTALAFEGRRLDPAAVWAMLRQAPALLLTIGIALALADGAMRWANSLVLSAWGLHLSLVDPTLPWRERIVPGVLEWVLWAPSWLLSNALFIAAIGVVYQALVGRPIAEGEAG